MFRIFIAVSLFCPFVDNSGFISNLFKFNKYFYDNVYTFEK
jgi:hypothetical protein